LAQEAICPRRPFKISNPFSTKNCQAMPHPLRFVPVMLILPDVCEALVSGKPAAQRPSTADIASSAEKMSAGHATVGVAESAEAGKHASKQSSGTEVPNSDRKAAVADSPDDTNPAFHQFQLFLRWQQQAKDFEEFLMHRAEFFVWRQNNRRQPVKSSEQPAKAPTNVEKLFPVARHGGKKLLSFIVTGEHGDAVPLQPQSLGKDDFSSTSEMTSQAEEVVDLLQQEEKVLHVQNATQSVLLIHLGMGDWFVVSGTLLFLLIYLIQGFWGLFGYVAFLVQHSFFTLYNLWGGSPISPPEHHFVVLQFHDDRTIEKDGIALPGSVFFKLKWEKLSDGQKYVFELAGLNAERWDAAVEECKEHPGESFDDLIGIRWEDFTYLQKNMLRQIGLTQVMWNQDDPQNFAIQNKMWNDLSDFEAFVAGQLGVKGKTHPDQWDKRKARIFHTSWKDMTPDQQQKLRKIGFDKSIWKCYHHPKVPGHGVTKFWHRMYTQTLRGLLVFWIILNCVWAFLILWRTGVFASLWSDFHMYFIEIAAVLFILWILWSIVRPLYEYIRDNIVAELRICMAHVKDTWRMTMGVCQQLCERCPKGANGECLFIAPCAAAEARRGRPQSQSQDHEETRCLHCLPCLCGRSAQRESPAALGQT